MPNYRQILYVSAAAPNVGPDAVNALLKQSRRNNARNDLTGLLLFTGQSFLQILEGPAEVVGHTLARIAGDPRHCQMLSLLDHDVEERSLGGWTMGYRSIAPLWPHDGAVFPLTYEALAERVGDDGTLQTLLNAFCDIELVGHARPAP